MSCKGYIFTLLPVLGIASLAVLTAQDAATDRIIFPHVLHVEDMGMECTECHEDLESSTALSHTLLPVMDVCADCHDGDLAPDDCQVCHTDTDDPRTYTWRPTTGLLFPHQPHLTGRIECERCHPGQTEAEALAPRTPAAMGTCMACHDTPITDTGCLICHTSLEGKRPASHGAEWDQTHGLFIGGSAGDDCAMCHQQTDCDACHALTQLEKKVHPVNYEFLHAGDVLGFVTECSTCHAVPQECQSCHMARNIMPLNHNSPMWLNPLDGGYHKEEALIRPDYCVSCHEPAVDLTCGRCHGN